MHYIACFGDSLIQGFPFGNKSSWTAAVEAQGKIKMLNYGLCGDCCDDIFERMEYALLPEYVKHIVFLGGANDALQRRPQNVIIGDIERILKWCQQKEYKLAIVLPLISSDELLNRRLWDLRQQIELKFKDSAYLLDLQPAIGLDAGARKKAYLDGVHPTAATYRAMGEYAAPLLLQWLEQSKKTII